MKQEIKFKECKICDILLPATTEYFHKRGNDTKDGLRNDCKKCRKESKKRDKNPLTKKCTTCNIRKPNTLEHFHAQTGKMSSKRSLCRECHKIYQKRQHLKNRYSLSIEEVEQMKEGQSNRCAICNVLSKRLVVDHCHDTDKVRKLLCDNCNHGLGNFQDSIQFLEQAIEYLKTN